MLQSLNSTEHRNYMRNNTSEQKGELNKTTQMLKNIYFTQATPLFLQLQPWSRSYLTWYKSALAICKAMRHYIARHFHFLSFQCYSYTVHVAETTCTLYMRFLTRIQHNLSNQNKLAIGLCDEMDGHRHQCRPRILRALEQRWIQCGGWCPPPHDVHSSPRAPSKFESWMRRERRVEEQENDRAPSNFESWMRRERRVLGVTRKIRMTTLTRVRVLNTFKYKVRAQIDCDSLCK
jgi:hypothetical protein